MKPATEETELRQREQGVDLLQIYPFTFALLSALVFLSAMVKMGYLAANPNVKYWIGNYPTYIAYLPLAFIFLAYIIHRIHGGPSKFASLVGLLGPSIMLFLGGYKVAISALTLSSAFNSMDCISNPQMYQLGQAWQAAADFKKTCKAPTGSAGFAASTINECDGYQDALKKNPSWQYLSYLETTNGCGGWCNPSTTLWVYPGGVQDPCSSAAAEALSTEVLYPAMQVAIYDIVILFLAPVGIALLGPKVYKYGLDW